MRSADRCKGAAPSEPSPLAEKLEMLIQHMWPDEATPPIRNAGVAAAITEATGTDLSSTMIWKLRAGRGGNPTLAQLTAMARFFAVPLSYFGEVQEWEPSAEDFVLVELIRAAGVSRSMLRAMAVLACEYPFLITEMMDRIARAAERQRSVMANGSAEQVLG
jgi:transcriptional regulator with XRE-family HTH domain